MEKIWKSHGKTDAGKEAVKAADKFNSSIKEDCRMWEEDIRASAAHADMLGECGVISKSEAVKIIKTLEQIAENIKSGTLKIDTDAEDIHSFVEIELVKRIGDIGKKLHTARSRNDQVATDLRLYTVKRLNEIGGGLRRLIAVVCDLAEKNLDTVMPGYTHLQRAQPVLFAHHLAAYGEMLERDCSRLADCRCRVNISPLGSGALAGTSCSIDRKKTANALGFDGVCFNSIDGVSDRDFCIETAAACAIIMMHLSRFCEEIIIWSSWEFRFVEIDGAFCTGSSIMPQKKNPDAAELIRGKTGRVFGSLTALLTVMKGLPLAYNKDMQETKQPLFDALDTVAECLGVFTPMLASLKVNENNMLAACSEGFLNATDCADYLVKKGVPFRDAYTISAAVVGHCRQHKKTLETLELSAYKKFSPLFEKDIFETVNIVNCVNKRTSQGGPSAESVKMQIEILKGLYDKD